MSQNLGISGKTAKRFLTTEITPLLALLGILLGLFAIAVTPREEEPQINVTFANIFIPFPGATAVEIAQLVSTPAEQVLSEIEGIEHVYSTSRPGMAMITVQYRVGEDRTQAIVRLYNKVFSNQDWLPKNLGVGTPIIKPKGIDDVPIVTATLWSSNPSVGAYELGQVAHTIEAELKRVPGTRDIYTIGEPERTVKVTLNPQSLSGYGIDLDDLRNSLRAANSTADGISVTSANRELLIQAGTFLTSASELGGLVIGMHDGKPVHLQDIATISEGPDHPQQYVWIGAGPQAASNGLDLSGTQPAVTIAVAKKPGTNAVNIAKRVIDRFEDMKGIFIPEGVEVTITRNYGETADHKARKLITKLIFATLSVIGLIVIALGWREALIVGGAVAITLLITLFASWAWGFTLNRVSLFALIFSIGILVDDAIVVVENIHRHLAMGAENLLEAIPKAVDEVGGPTILATFTVIAALLPMAFVSGLMGPYMSPIPINASMGMLISLAVAFIITPWSVNKVLGNSHHAHAVADESQEHKLTPFFARIMSPFLDDSRGRANRWKLLIAILLLIAASVSLGFFKLVVLKMLPFDNKSEFQVVLDMPEGTALEQTTRVLSEIGDFIATVPEVTNYQVYAGTASPIGFNGLVRQYYLREGAHLGDIQVNLVDKSERDRKSHEIARSVREPVQAIARQFNGNAKIVEVPPGPPVMSPLVAEIYGVDYAGQIRTAKDVRTHFESTADIVDVDDMIETPSEKRIIIIDRAKAARLGIAQSSVAAALATVLDGEDVTYMHGANLKYSVPIRLEYSEADKANLDEVMSLKVRSQSGALVPISEITTVVSGAREFTIYHKDLLPVVYVTGDMAGDLDSPLYGLFDIAGKIDEHDEFEQWYLTQPDNPYNYSLKWDGEWQVTYETFRDMGAAYAVGLVLIYLLVVAQFRSYLVPLVIMAPIPLTIIGIMPGHVIAQAQFTATSMIGMIALAGIIVRNSILLVDFINQQVREGEDFRKAVINAAAVRTQPIVLTAVAAMAGGFFILDDPIFSGLAVSLIFGLLASTILTLVVIPVVYFAAMQNKLQRLRA
ncbi:multidrug transporter AcrB [Solemya velum gill symbiont]|uniref:efflux RND transporter permease subunit n=1 Tax=Solemya velum gill symbiont TaxID=2340 RepID=UPI000996F31B|nr:efflux RND transporter permease subunit [Solemya velum gill symbiont]OOZ13686.1 multidrug transporter AcrB [Solemya velum gill symbiont]OOZ18830.1 multidrug transporter AcrB [Solemya velum gill symbiont]OOZ21434.1 multidrug transporter AcrB [Solemya velum gill symbiont]OOZ23326.1 multidrug transporter AcrB [Solemya velum gill symbiont]OOZ28605.1 multidrug transporter AcrB [Solemya velum gill symbiont]